MKRVYKELNVYDASNERIKFIFDNFPKIYLSFSGGKDSGVMLNLMLDYMRANGITKKIGLMVMDNETNYSYSLQFMHSIVEKNLDLLDVYWICMPVTLPCSVSSYQIDWQPWHPKEKHRWTMPMPDKSYVVNMENHKFDFFKVGMLDKDFYDHFAEWYSQGETCACLIGIRTSESLNRYRAIMNAEKETLLGRNWTKKNGPNSYNVYPIFDWKVDDIWVANCKFEWEYNKLYDIFYKAGIPVSSMRVASAFMSESKSNLNLYRIIDPTIWARLCGRVCGANFAATYGKQLNYRNINLPEGHTWKSFVKFLLATLPKEPAENFKLRFIQSLKYWGRVGRGLSEEMIHALEKAKVKMRINGTTPHGGNSLRRVVIKIPPDHLDMLPMDSSSVTSWKRFAVTILKNDHTCKYMGLAPTKAQAGRQKIIQEKYRKI